MTHVWSQPNPNHNTKRFVCRQYLLFCLLNIPLIYICYFWELDLQLLSFSSHCTCRIEHMWNWTHGIEHVWNWTRAELNMCGIEHVWNWTSVELNMCGIEHVWNWTCVWKCGIEHVCGSVELNMCVEVWNWTHVELNMCVEVWNWTCVWKCGIEHVWF